MCSHCEECDIKLAAVAEREQNIKNIKKETKSNLIELLEQTEKFKEMYLKYEMEIHLLYEKEERIKKMEKNIIRLNKNNSKILLLASQNFSNC